jgi:hypothetical protein
METLNRYSVLPFTGPRYHENDQKNRSNDAGCAICGKVVVKPYKHTATVVGGGDWALTQAEVDDVNDPGYMGLWPIGPACHKKYLIKQSLAS